MLRGVINILIFLAVASMAAAVSYYLLKPAGDVEYDTVILVHGSKIQTHLSLIVISIILLFSATYVCAAILDFIFGIPNRILSFFRNRGKETLTEKLILLSTRLVSIDTNASRKLLRNVSYYLQDVPNGKVLSSLAKAQISLMDRDASSKKHIEELDRVSSGSISHFMWHQYFLQRKEYKMALESIMPLWGAPNKHVCRLIVNTCIAGSLWKELHEFLSYAKLYCYVSNEENDQVQSLVLANISKELHDKGELSAALDYATRAHRTMPGSRAIARYLIALLIKSKDDKALSNLIYSYWCEGPEESIIPLLSGVVDAYPDTRLVSFAEKMAANVREMDEKIEYLNNLLVAHARLISGTEKPGPSVGKHTHYAPLLSSFLSLAVSHKGEENGDQRSDIMDGYESFLHNFQKDNIDHNPLFLRSESAVQI